MVQTFLQLIDGFPYEAHTAYEMMLSNIDACDFKEKNTDGLSAFYLACEADDKNTTFDLIVDKMLDYPDKCNFDEIDDDGYTVLMSCLKNRSITVSLKMLNMHEWSYNNISSEGCTPLMLALSRKDVHIALKMLERIDDCNIGQVTTLGNTAIMFACSSNLTIPALKILDHPDCNLGHQNHVGFYAFHSACSKNMLSVVRKMLINYPEHCHLDKVYENETPLMVACRMNNLMALDILNQPDLCYMDYVYKKSYNEKITAFSTACYNAYFDVAIRILDFPKQCGLNESNNIDTFVDILRQIRVSDSDSESIISGKSQQDEVLTVDDVISKLILVEPKIHTRFNDLNNYEEIIMKAGASIANPYTKIVLYLAINRTDLLNEDTAMNHAQCIANDLETIQRLKLKKRKLIDGMINNLTCPICIETTTDHYILNPCNHVIALHKECVDRLSMRCPICNQHVSKRVRGFVV